MRVPANLRRAGLLLVFGCLAGCRKEEAAPDTSAREVAPAASAAAPPAPPASVASPTLDAAPSAFVRPDGKPSELIDLGLYQFRVQSFARCGKPPATSKPLVVATVQVNAKGSDLFVAPRDVNLEKDGVIFASLPNDKLPKECGAALAPVQLRPSGSANGVVGFELPSDVDVKGAKLTYKPTRWGGAPPAVVAVPDAF